MNIIAAVAIFVLGGLVGHVITLPPVSAETSTAQISPLGCGLKIGLSGSSSLMLPRSEAKSSHLPSGEKRG